MVEKSRPFLVLATPQSNDARALVVVAPLTSLIRGLRGEVPLGKPRWLPKTSTVNGRASPASIPASSPAASAPSPAEHYIAVKTTVRELLQL